MAFFQQNIGVKGRIVRGLGALCFFLLAVIAWQNEKPLILIAVLLLAASFTALEAAKGWCVARACGIKTKF
jgi:ABC-type uncharacterized transport system permease subunit